MVKKLYPNGKAKAFVLTYDDGVEDDIKFIDLLNKYNLKATFNLNSGLMANEFSWTTENGYKVTRLSRAVASKLYKGHEVASHSLTHPYLRDWNMQRLFAEISIDKENLGSIFKTSIHGFAIPFDYYDILVTKCVKESRFEYMRVSEESHNFLPATDYFKITPTIFHLDPNLLQITKDFLKADNELAVYMIVGHSYDLVINNLFDDIETVFKLITNDNEIINLTTHQYVSYLKAMDQCEINEIEIKNNSKKTLWFQLDDKIISINPKESYKL